MDRLRDDCAAWIWGLKPGCSFVAHEAKTEDERKRFLDMTLSWSQAAAREDGRFWIGSCALKQ
jgi:hypothetical protein